MGFGDGSALGGSVGTCVGDIVGASVSLSEMAEIGNVVGVVDGRRVGVSDGRSQYGPTAKQLSGLWIEGDVVIA